KADKHRFMKTEDVAEYYDNAISQQVDSGINDRIYHLYKRLLGLGLKPSSNVLELGCGIGALTFLLSKYLKTGKIEAVDLSEQSIAFARKRIKSPFIIFVSGDIVYHQPRIKNVDFITLFDILEHIPVEKHCEIFRNLSAIVDENTKILINIPNPAYIEYDREHHPDALQIIDQPLPSTFILENLEANGLTLTFFESYSIWVENDYHFFVAGKKKPFKEVTLSSKSDFFQKLKKRLERVYIRMRYKYC
ncbi:MAG: class I SAM-dependent methyltransferase, partial [Flavisolibacter sp.]